MNTTLPSATIPMFKSLPDAILIVDTQGRILLANNNAEEMFRYEHDELVGMQVDNLLPKEFRVKQGRLRAGYTECPVKHPMGIGMEFAALRKDGTEFLAEISLGPIWTDDGMFCRCSWFLTSPNNGS